MSWTVIVEFFAGLFGGVKAVKVAKAAGELEAGKREVAAVEADVAAIKGELQEPPIPASPSTPAPTAPASPVAPTTPTATTSSHITD